MRGFFFLVARFACFAASCAAFPPAQPEFASALEVFNPSSQNSAAPAAFAASLPRLPPPCFHDVLFFRLDELCFPDKRFRFPQRAAVWAHDDVGRAFFLAPRFRLFGIFAVA